MPDDELTRAIVQALGCEESSFYGVGVCVTHGPGWPCRKAQDVAAALAPLIVQREQRAFDRGYDKAMEGIEARWRSLWEGRWAPPPSPDDYECCASGRCEVCRG